MATKQGMSGVDVRAEVNELAEKLPLWIGKIYQYDNTSFGFRLNGEEKARYMLYCEKGVRAHLVSELPPAPKNPSGFSMYLRKYIEGGRVLSIRQKGIERVIIIEIGKGVHEYHLIIELFDEGNLILTDRDFVIINALTQHRFRDRDIVAGAVYEREVKSPEDLTYEEFRDKIIAEDADIVRALATKLLLGGPASEEICKLSGISKSMPARFSDEAQLRPVYDAMKEWLGRLSAAEAVIDAKGAFPYVSSMREPLSKYPTFSLALDAYYPKPEKKAAEETKVKLSAKERIRLQQEQAIVSFEKKAALASEASEIIYGHYGEVKETIDVLEAASKKMSWQDIAAVLKKSDMPAAKRIVSLDAAKASVVLDLGEKQKVTIFIHESLEANAGRYSEQAKKFRAKKAGAVRAMEAGAKRAEKAEERKVGKLKAKWYHRFRWMETSDGVLVIGGRNADQNEELVKKYMEGKDRFLHADVFGASTVIVKGETARMDEAAAFAASYSRLWASGSASGSVIEALPSQVSKTPESGEYVAHGSFIIRGERTIHKDVPLEVSIGLMTEPVLAVIGGVPSVIEKKTKVFVRLRPGTFEGNDIAKKVLRKLKESLPDGDSKAVRAVLNTEAVAAFVPPGGSDIV
ncbi:MAG TPA: ribosome rescue protein RqcH [Methanocorpusculum sp.]|nr:ribosome rescue protein RqcH [Methanocorpusculum sp.]